MNANNENLRDILNRFYSQDDAAKIERDISAGERLLADNPAPQPDTELIGSIKAELSAKLAAGKRRYFAHILETAVATAAVLIIGITLFMIHPQQTRPGQKGVAAAGGISAKIWESDDLMNDDVSLAMLAADIDAVEDDVFAMRFDSEESQTINFDDIETEFADIGDDFWKG